MYKLFLVAIIFLFSTGFFPTNGFNFEDKTLRKELQKLSGVENPDWKEIVVPESLLAANPMQGKFLALMNQNNDLQKYVYAGRVNTCRQGGCSNPSETLNVETSEYLDYLIVFDTKFSVQQVKVYNYQATHGQEVTNKGWLKQFQGYDGKKSLTVGKGIDAISGATVSVYSIVNDIQDKTRLFNQLVAK
ncbi:MAG: FMN-binding protein [Bacteroidota bacterium]|nr:FMN-binding protein [Bacteroidota bacterium]MDO9614419.1 FMN-binding protein [Bacteroidota bacterium]